MSGLGAPSGRAALWRSADDYVNAALLAVIAVVLVVQVFSRYVLNVSLGWTTELASTLLGWLMFLGAPAMLKRQSHMEIYLFGGLRRVPQTVIRLLIELASGAFYAIVLIGSFDYVASTRFFETPALGIRGDVITAVIPAGSAYLLVRTAIRIRDLLRPERPRWIREHL